MKKAMMLSLATLSIVTIGRTQSNDILSHGGFGHSVAVSGNHIFVGEPLNNKIPGRVYMFSKDPETGFWVEEDTIHPAGDSVGNQFGSAVAASGGILAASGRDVIHLFDVDAAGVWKETGSIVSDDTSASFGTSLAMDNGRLFATSQTAERPVIVQTFDRSADGKWEKTGAFELPIQAIDDIPIAITVDNGLLFAADIQSVGGLVYAFELTSGKPVPVDSMRGSRLAAYADVDFGASVAYHEGSLLVGAPETNDGAGAVTTYRPGDFLMGQLTAETLEDDPAFGSAVGVDGLVAVVGAESDLFGYGSAFIFERVSPDEPWSLSQSISVDRGDEFASITGGDVPCEDGEASGFGCSNVDIKSFLSIESLGLDPGMQTNDVWGWTDPESDKEYAIVCSFKATTFIDVTDPNNPIVLGNLPATPGTRPNWWRDAKTYKNYVYIVADNVGDHGLQIFDLTQLRDVTRPPVEFEPTAHYDAFGSAHNIIINEETGFAYVVGINGEGQTCGGGSYMLDLENPLDPKFVGCFNHAGTGGSQEGATHDAQCVIYHGPDERYTGKEICFASNGDAISIADFTDKTNVIPIAAARYPNSSYTHQGWLTEDHRYFFQNDETDEINGMTDGTRTMIWDFAELDDPILLNMYVSSNKATDHNYYVSGSYLYQSNYVAGLRVLDISDVENPVEVGFFDTMPWGDDKPGFGGSWSNYPFFESGTIVVSSGEEGVFFLKRSEVTP